MSHLCGMMKNDYVCLGCRFRTIIRIIQKLNEGKVAGNLVIMLRICRIHGFLADFLWIIPMKTRFKSSLWIDLIATSHRDVITIPKWPNSSVWGMKKNISFTLRYLKILYPPVLKTNHYGTWPYVNRSSLAQKIGHFSFAGDVWVPQSAWRSTQQIPNTRTAHLEIAWLPALMGWDADDDN